MDKTRYLELVLTNWKSICLSVAEEEQRTIGSFSNHVSLPPGHRNHAEGIEPKFIRSRREALRAKALIDACSFTKVSEEVRVYAALLNDELQKWIKDKKLKAPYQFLLSVPVTQWSRYKSDFYPKPRMIPQLSKELNSQSSFRLIKPNSRPRKVQRRRGYSDHGYRTPDDVSARRRADLEAEYLKQVIRNLDQARVLAIRSHSKPEQQKTAWLRWCREYLKLPKHTTLENMELIVKKIYQQGNIVK